MSTVLRKQVLVCGPAHGGWIAGACLCMGVIAFVVANPLRVTHYDLRDPYNVPLDQTWRALLIPGIVLMVALLLERFGCRSRETDLPRASDGLSCPSGTVQSEDVVAWDGLSLDRGGIVVLTTTSGNTWWAITRDEEVVRALKQWLWLSAAKCDRALRFQKSRVGFSATVILVAGALLLVPVLGHLLLRGRPKLSMGALTADVVAALLEGLVMAIAVVTGGAGTAFARRFTGALGWAFVHTPHSHAPFADLLPVVLGAMGSLMVIAFPLRERILRVDWMAIGGARLAAARAIVSRFGWITVRAPGTTTRHRIARVFGRAAQKLVGASEETIVGRILQHRIEAVQRLQGGTSR